MLGSDRFVYNSEISRTRQQLPQHIRQDAAVQEVINFDRRVDAQDERDLQRLAISAVDHERDALARTNFPFQARDVECFAAIQFEGLGRRPLVELARQHTHAHKVAAVDPFKTLRDHHFHTQQARALSGPVP